MQNGSVVEAEIAHFNALAAEWWNPDGPMRPLHQMNGPRAQWVGERAVRVAGAGARLLDVGCGAGLLAEALAKQGFAVTGVDAGAEVVAVAEAHATAQGLDIAYRNTTAEALVAEGMSFPVVTALEIIEHVAEPVEFLRALRALLAPGGVLFLSTLNRTPASYAVAKLGAEYVLKLLPKGTHDWRKFIKPEELARFARAAGLRLTDTAGLSYSPFTRRFSVSRDLSVNYLAMAVAV
ncbi:bifunctional 2-polyprenyl-6-hydroxyphenol methylase/3-demethylubiquinol 3-O-methyltransferase UbiG [Acidocella sp.]|uniref:bifunctional 2-polyprenyl-6-hydroxyphenol methylase/3-demethylubiquinol 3-O-methyltransferase UbiG n=1 Tax=Acidocella sp. TaxID=50710 RepID=UPI00261501AE|nr:bifunctional 2-polyprenyl-6-hydroxyphenol methylase/3-demethylubiquinol 3-O-methyltransferase UbiG [Acidocella sp.]